ncbi:MAG TPA: DNA-processing protein DprA [Candidatus Lustribacter sp.]|nr:DNA-processing protein DprA [Candidatus Lustribacter sp.]
MQDTLRRFLTRADLAVAAHGRLAGSALTGLWVAGDLGGLAAPTVAVVGTRAPSEDGRRLARQLARDLGAAGVCVLSGLALGIDAAAHGGALEAGAPTIGVLGGGHDRFFPPRNAELARRIIAGGGAVLSPYPPDHPAYPWQFLARNGIVAALADAVVVVEAAARSGALNTASWAADRAIPVMACPGDVGRPKVAGCLSLIRDGATLVRDAADVLAELGIATPAMSAAEPARAADPRDAGILAALGNGPADADTMVAASALPPALALARIGDLLASGTIVNGSDGRFRRSTP